MNKHLARLVSILLLLLLCGCEVADQHSRNAELPGVLRKGNGAEPQTLDPHKAEAVPAANILRDLYEGLLSEAPDGELVGGVAKSWEISPDGLQYTFHLRDNARWSNGEQLTAHDFVYSLRRVIDPKTGSSYAQVLGCILHADAIIAGHMPVESLGVFALDATTLQIRLKSVTPYFLGLLVHSTTYPVHRATVERSQGRLSRPGELVSNGAYVLSAWVVQSHISVKKNPYYWNAEQVRINQVNYYGIDNPSQEIQRYRAGELDMTASIPVGQVAWAQQQFGDQVHISPYLGTYYYGLNVSQAPFNNQPALRKALWLAIDRRVIVEKITAAGELPAYSWVPPGMLHYQQQLSSDSQWTNQQRIAEAQRLYQRAGYSQANPLELELLYNTSDNHKRIALAVAAMWREVLGVRTRLVNEEWKVFLQHRRDTDQTQVIRGGWIADYNDASNFAELFQTGHGMNHSGYANPEYDRLIVQAGMESDMQKRQQLLQAAEAILLRDVPLIPLFFYVSKSLVKPYIHGYQHNVMDHHYSKDLRIRH